MKKVLVIVPTINAQVAAETANLFGVLHGKNFIQNEFRFATSIMEGVRPVTAARNAMASFFLESDFDILWMIDQDIVPHPEILKLLEVDGDIIAPMMPIMNMNINHATKKFKFNFPICAVNYEDMDDLKSGVQPPFEDGGILDVDAVGFGCTMIHRRVLEDKRMWADPNWTTLDGKDLKLTEKDTPPIFQFRFRPNGSAEVGEDYGFCWRAKKLGYRVKLHADIMVGHLKQVDLYRMLGVQEFIDLKIYSQERAKDVAEEEPLRPKKIAQ